MKPGIFISQAQCNSDQTSSMLLLAAGPELDQSCVTSADMAPDAEVGEAKSSILSVTKT